MVDIRVIDTLGGKHFQRVSLVSTHASLKTARHALIWLSEQPRITGVQGYYSPALRQAVYVFWVETPFRCTARARVVGMTGPGTPFYTTE